MQVEVARELFRGNYQFFGYFAHLRFTCRCDPEAFSRLIGIIP